MKSMQDVQVWETKAIDDCGAVNSSSGYGGRVQGAWLLDGGKGYYVLSDAAQMLLCMMRRSHR